MSYIFAQFLILCTNYYYSLSNATAFHTAIIIDLNSETIVHHWLEPQVEAGRQAAREGEQKCIVILLAPDDATLTGHRLETTKCELRDFSDSICFDRCLQA